jgi:NAD(P)H-nitrite reductase large subunit
VPAFAGVEHLHEVFCLSSHDGSLWIPVVACEPETNYRRTMIASAISSVRTIGSSTEVRATHED